MNLLPIVGRELRVRSRRKADYRLRLGAGAIVGLIVFGAASSANRFPDQANFAWQSFTWLAGMLFIFCLFEGARNTADSFSSEKREGTLGLLFLTDLKGVDVVLGKAAATGLNSLYSLLAAIPFLGVLLLMGGVTGGEFARIGLTLINVLFFAVSAGLVASSTTQHERRAMVVAAMLLAGAVFLPALVGLILDLATSQTAPSLLMAGSPACACVLAFEPMYVKHAHWFWTSLGLSHALGWCGIVHASRAVRRLGQAKEKLEVKRSRGPFRSYASQARGMADTVKDANPIYCQALIRSGDRKWIWLTVVLAILLSNWWILHLILSSAAPAAPRVAIFQVMNVISTAAFVLL